MGAFRKEFMWKMTINLKCIFIAVLLGLPIPGLAVDEEAENQVSDTFCFDCGKKLKPKKSASK